MEKNIYVKAPGIIKNETFTRLICPTTAKYEDYIKFEDIPDMIKGSESLSVSVIGDILGPSLKSRFLHIFAILYKFLQVSARLNKLLQASADFCELLRVASNFCSCLAKIETKKKTESKPR